MFYFFVIICDTYICIIYPHITDGMCCVYKTNWMELKKWTYFLDIIYNTYTIYHINIFVDDEIDDK